MAREPSAKYVRLMNGRADRILERAWDDATLAITYDRTGWTASLAMGSRRQASGVGATEELALRALEAELGLETER